jgi:hypothetical protein
LSFVGTVHAQTDLTLCKSNTCSESGLYGQNLYFLGIQRRDRDLGEMSLAPSSARKIPRPCPLDSVRESLSRPPVPALHCPEGEQRHSHRLTRNRTKRPPRAGNPPPLEPSGTHRLSTSLRPRRATMLRDAYNSGYTETTELPSTTN